MRVTIHFECDVLSAGLFDEDKAKDAALCAWQTMNYSTEGVITVHGPEEISCFTVQDVKEWAA
jgi:hypothetical protein